MRILLTVHQFFPTYRAGTEVLTLSVAKELIKSGHEVRILTAHPTDSSLAENERFDEYEYEGIHIYRFHHSYTPMCDQSSMIEVGYNNKLSVCFLNTVIKHYSPNLVHHFHLNRLGVGIINCLGDARIRQYFTPTDFWMVCPTAQLMLGEGNYCSGPDFFAGNCIKHFARDKVKGIGGKIIECIPDKIFDNLSILLKKNKIIKFPMHQEVRALSDRLSTTILSLNRLNGIISPNSFMTNLLIRYGVDSHLIRTRQFGVDIKVKNQSSALKMNNKLSIGFIGTLAPHKGCHILIDAVNKLPQEKVELKIYGGHTDFPDYYDSLIKSASVNDNIHFCGTFSNENIGEIISQFDILVVPSIWYENTPLVIYSAYACKCPVIASDLPGISEVVKHNVNGLLYKPGDSNDLMNTLLRVLIVPELISLFKANCKTPSSVRDYTNELLELWGGNDLCKN